MGVRIIGTGSYAPEKILTNQDLERMVETSDEWIRTRTGIRERRIADRDTASSDLALEAARRALDSAGVDPAQLSILSVASVTHDHPFPSTSCILQHKLGVPVTCACYDVQAACSGLLYSLQIAVSMLKCRKNARYALILGAEKLSSIVDWTDRGTCVLFGDAASALLLENDGSDEPDMLLSCILGADGSHSSKLCVPAGGSAMPASRETVDGRLHFIRMGGQEVFRLAVNAMTGASRTALQEAGLTVDQIRWIIPHQANKRIMDAVASRLGAQAEQVFVNVDRYGNTSSASIGICLDEIVRGGQVRKGDSLLLTAFGAGMTWGAAVIRW